MTVESRSGVGAHRRQLPEDVAAYVREMIISGEVRPGDFLRTAPIAKAVGVSNTPVREGLLILSGEGFVELVPRRGFVVSEFSSQDVRDLFWAQAVLAAELARRAAAGVTAEQLDHLRTLYERHTAALADGDDEATVRLGHEFHRSVNLAAGSRRLAAMLASIVRQLPNRFYNDIEGHTDDTMEAHPKIIAALADRDGDRAADLMRAHIMSGADELVANLAKRGLWQDGE
ncbi:GntR family transcriptional regulator [Gordonia iterans]|uniref:GntR family transcriptional regulator n=1 Tax=Gordonia iterans TaxID=1004901 RepID=A0A2S0KBM4_9ACTN|nr:GntR family transcriptional regulator [Gordonia iterans]AVL99086.1 GntR family transcriptional regulator [Gordonia iterans]